MKSAERDIFGCIGVLMVIPALIAWDAVVTGYTLVTLWGWFITPIFDLPPLSIPAAIGLAMVVAFLAKNRAKIERTQNKEIWQTYLEWFLTPPLTAVFILATGWVVQLFL